MQIAINGWVIIIIFGVITLISGLFTFYGQQLVSKEKKLYVTIMKKEKLEVNEQVVKNIDDIIKIHIKGKKDKEEVLKKVNLILKYGNDYRTNGIEDFRSMSLLITKEMKKLRYDTLILLESLGLKETDLFKDSQRELDVSTANGQEMFAKKQQYVAQYLGVLNSLKEYIEKIDVE
jgi:hypothetical protein